MPIQSRVLARYTYICDGNSKATSSRNFRFVGVVNSMLTPRVSFWLSLRGWIASENMHKTCLRVIYCTLLCKCRYTQPRSAIRETLTLSTATVTASPSHFLFSANARQRLLRWWLLVYRFARQLKLEACSYKFVISRPILKVTCNISSCGHEGGVQFSVLLHCQFVHQTCDDYLDKGNQ